MWRRCRGCADGVEDVQRKGKMCKGCECAQDVDVQRTCRDVSMVRPCCDDCIIPLYTTHDCTTHDCTRLHCTQPHDCTRLHDCARLHATAHNLVDVTSTLTQGKSRSRHFPLQDFDFANDDFVLLLMEKVVVYRAATLHYNGQVILPAWIWTHR